MKELSSDNVITWFPDVAQQTCTRLSRSHLQVFVVIVVLRLALACQGCRRTMNGWQVHALMTPGL